MSNTSTEIQLKDAAQQGDEEELKRLIAAGVSVNAAHGFGWTALHEAAEEGHTKVVQTLIDKGADVNAYNIEGFTVLHKAALGGHNSVVQTLITAQADVSTTDSEGRTALHEAANEGHDQVTKTLIVAGIDVNTADKAGETALHLASAEGHNSVVQTLIIAQADVNTTDESGRTALHLAALEGHNSVVEILIAAQADVNNADKFGKTALHLAASKEDDRVVETLIDAAADINSADKDGMTALHLTAKKGHNSLVQTLISEGAGINSANNEGLTVLHDALLGGHSSAALSLIDAGANINTTDYNRRTALHLAARNFNNSVIPNLIAVGADINATDSNELTALHHAAMCGHNSVAQALIAAGADVNTVDAYGRTALHWAAWGGHRHVVTTLIGNTLSRLLIHSLMRDEHYQSETPEGTSVKECRPTPSKLDVLITNTCGQTALHLALIHRKKKVVRLLTPHMSTYLNNYKTLYDACRTGDNTLLDWWLDNSSLDINATDETGDTALHIAIRAGNIVAVRLLLLRSVDLCKRNESGKNVLEEAKESKYEEIIKELCQASEMTELKFIILNDTMIEQLKCQPCLLKMDICPLSRYSSHPKYGSVRLTRTCIMIHNEVECVMKNIITFVKGTNWSTNLGLQNPQYLLVGSNKERTKIQKPDEFDYLLTFDAKGVGVYDMLCGLSVCPPGLAYLTYPVNMSDKTETTIQLLSSLQAERKWVTSSTKFHKYFWQLLDRIICDESQVFSGVKHLKLKYRPKHGYMESKACSTVTMTWTGEQYNDMEITVDLTLALRFDYKCPFLSPEGDVPDHFYLVPKPPHRNSLLGLAYSDEEREAMWKVDFVKLECEQVANMGPHVKHAYITCKCIRAILPPCRLSEECFKAEKIISSFMMKLMFLREREHFIQDHLSLEQMVLTVFDKLAEYLEKQYLPDFWSFRKPYSEKLGEVEQEDMTSYGQVNVLAGSKHDLKHCLQVARLLRFLIQELIQYNGVIEQAIEQQRHCTYATLRVYETCGKGDIELAEKLLDCGAMFNIANDEGLTPMQLASSAGHHKMVEWLVNHGVDLNSTDSEGRTEVNHLCAGDINTEQMLADDAVDIHQSDNLGGSPLIHVSNRGHIGDNRDLREGYVDMCTLGNDVDENVSGQNIKRNSLSTPGIQWSSDAYAPMPKRPRLDN